MDTPSLLWRGPRVAVVEMYGTIGSAIKTQQYAPALKELREDGRTRAVVLDIDSPGGSAIVSDYLYLAIKKLAAKKPVVSFIRGLGASGGYYLAVAGRTIVASRMAVVGSIGVISIRPETEGLLEKIGVRVEVVKTGPLKGMGLPFTPITDEERRKEQELNDRILDRFVRVVADGRRTSEETVRGWATGEVFLAEQALERGMVDELGDLERAVEMAADMARISEKEKFQRVRPHRPPLVQRLAGQGAGAVGAVVASGIAAGVERALTPRIEYRWRG